MLTTTFPAKSSPCLKGEGTPVPDLDIGTKAPETEDEAEDTAAAAEEDTRNESLQVPTVELELLRRVVRTLD